MRDRGQIAQDLRARGRVVRLGIGRVAVLIEHHPVGMLRSHTPCDSDGFVGTPRPRGVDDLGTPHAQDLRALDRGVLRHHADEFVALELRGHSERDAGVAARGLEDGATRREQTVLLCLLDHAQRCAVLDGPGRIAVLELGPQAHIRAGRQAGQSDKRRVADRVEQRVVAHGARGQPPATAGRIVTESPSATTVSSPPRKRTSSSLR